MQPLAISNNKRYLMHADGTPFFYLGDTGWEIGYRLNRDEIKLYLKDRADKGFTVIHMFGLSEFGKLERPNGSGKLPFVDKDPTKPNDAFFDHIGAVMDEAAAVGLRIGLLPCFGDHVGPLAHGSNPPVINRGNAGVYGEYLGRRFAEKQLVWILGGDRHVETDEQRATWQALGAGLRKSDGGKHLVAFHPPGVCVSSSRFFQNDETLDFNMIQAGHSARNLANYEAVEADYKKRPVKPTMDTEFCYENHPESWQKDARRFDDYDSRKGAYWSLFAGGHGYTYGCNDIFPFYRSPDDLAIYGHFYPIVPWQHALNFPGARQMTYVRALMQSRPFFTRIPDQSLLVSSAGDGAEHVRATRDESGSYAFIYCVTGKPVTVDLSQLSGEKLTPWWYDPRTGGAWKGSEIAREGKKEFTPPTVGYGHDWILVLDDAAQDYPAPGKVE